MCRRNIINAGIAQVVIRNTPTDYTVVDVEDWIRNDESIQGISCGIGQK
jgi:dCMP deaminase